MKEVVRSNDLVRLSWLQALLKDGDIASLVLDGHSSAIEGSILAISRRLVVAEEDYQRACQLLREAGEEPTALDRFFP
jgi:hypothetical protein